MSQLITRRLSRRATLRLGGTGLIASALGMTARSVPVLAQSATPATLASPETCPSTTEDQNVALIHRWYDEALNTGNLDALDAIVASDVVIVAPDPRPTGLAWVLLIFSGIELVTTQRESGRVRRLLKSGWHGYLLDVAPSLCYLGVIVLAVGALLGHAQLLVNRWVIGLNVTLLGTATANAWDLLIAAGKAQHD